MVWVPFLQIEKAFSEKNHTPPHKKNDLEGWTVEDLKKKKNEISNKVPADS